MSSAEDKELKRACEDAIGGTKQRILMAIRAGKNKGAWGKGKIGSKGSQMAKPRVIAISTKDKGEKSKAFLRVFKYTNGGALEQAEIYKLKRLSKMEVLTSDPSGCTFQLGFDNLKHQRVAPIQWTMRNLDDRNRLWVCIITICREAMGHLPKVVGIDIVELALWAKEHASAVPKHDKLEDGDDEDSDSEDDMEVSVESELVSQQEEEDIEALLGTYVMGIGEAEVFSERLKRELHALEAANVHAILESQHLVDEVLKGLDSATSRVEDMDEWLALFNVKLRHMREDIEAIESRNNKLETQSMNYKALSEELDNLLGRLHIPAELSDCLAAAEFDESTLDSHIKACDQLGAALRGFEPPAMDPSFSKIRAVREKRAELDIIKLTFARKACQYMRDYFANSVDSMINDKSNFSQRGQLKKPDHTNFRNKCRKYARLLHHLKILDRNSLAPLRKSYCASLNKLLRQEAREFSNELRAGIKAPKVPTVWFEGPNPNQNFDTTNIFEAYTKMLSVFVPLLVEESVFLSRFLRFEASSPHPPQHDESDDSDNELTTEIDENFALEMGALNESLRDLLDGIQEDFYAVVEWAHKIDPLLCISMHGITEQYINEQKAEVTGYVRLLLDAIEDKISTLFIRFVDESRQQIEKYDRNVKQTGVMPFVPRFALLATRMEQYIQGQSRDLVDHAYMKIIGVMFVTLDKISQCDLKHLDIFLLENYAAFQNSLYDLANCVPTLAKFYHQACESYEQACAHHISVVIYYVFERLFQFARKLEDLMVTNSPEEIPFQAGLTKQDLRKVVKTNLSGVDKQIAAMHKKLVKNLTCQELIPTLWDKLKKEYMDKYETFAQLASKIYPNENVPSVSDIRDVLNSI